MGTEEVTGAPLDACRSCHGWGRVNAKHLCQPCRVFARSAIREVCRRCDHEKLVNRNDLCRLCLLTIRTTDKTWLAFPYPGRSTQLFLLLRGLSLPAARSLDRQPTSKRQLPPRNPAWVCDALDLPSAKDPAICAPLPAGQLILLAPRRTLTLALARRIGAREPAGYPESVAIARDLSRELHRGTAWEQNLRRLLGLVLAAAEADGLNLITTADVRGATWQAAVGEVLRRAGRLSPSTAPPVPFRAVPARRGRIPVSCAGCDSWGRDLVCGGCARFGSEYPTGRCARCSRNAVPVREQLCRSCLITVRDLGPDAPGDGSTQLSLGGDFAPRLHNHGRRLGYEPTHWKAHTLRRQRGPAPQPVSPHLVDPVQPELFVLRRDWSVLAGSGVALPTLTLGAQRVLDRVREAAAAGRWKQENLRSSLRTVRILVGWLGADAPIPEDDVRALAATVEHTNAGRVLPLLRQYGLLVPAPAQADTADERWVALRIAQLPRTIEEELRTWVKVVRGGGRRRHRTKSWQVIRNYLYAASPTLLSWSEHHGSLRDITADDVRDAVGQYTGTVAHGLRTGLRSIFTALKEERVIFRDPTRVLELAAVKSLPTALLDEQLRGLIERAHGTCERLVVALVAIHALGTEDLRRLALAGADVATGTLRVPRPGRNHIVYLDELTLRLMIQWLRERRERWPHTTNPHLLITEVGAHGLSATPPISTSLITRLFRRLGLQARHVRADRLLDEASATSDPIHLMRVFGISSNTALRYLHAAHPHRGSVPPR